MKRSYAQMRLAAFLLAAIAITDVSAQPRPTTGYAPVNGLRMYYEVHGRGEPVVLLHGAFMTITNNWDGWIGELSRTRKVIAVEMQGHGRTADIPRELSSEALADDVAAQTSRAPSGGSHRIQHGWRRGNAGCSSTSRAGAAGCHHLVHIPP
jgi:hypothetical protein